MARTINLIWYHMQWFIIWTVVSWFKFDFFTLAWNTTLVAPMLRFNFQIKAKVSFHELLVLGFNALMIFYFLLSKMQRIHLKVLSLNLINEVLPLTNQYVYCSLQLGNTLKNIEQTQLFTQPCFAQFEYFLLVYVRLWFYFETFEALMEELQMYGC